MGLTLGAFVTILGGSCWAGRLYRRAAEADQVAAAALARAQQDSAAAAQAAAAYAAERADKERALASLAEADGQLEAQQRVGAAERRRLTQKLDSMAATISDTATFVPRAAYDGAIQLVRVTAAQLATVEQRLDVRTQERDTEHALRIQAEAGWAKEQSAAAAARASAAASDAAAEAWRRAAQPGLVVRIGRSLPAVGLGAGLAALAILAAGR